MRLVDYTSGGRGVCGARVAVAVDEAARRADTPNNVRMGAVG